MNGLRPTTKLVRRTCSLREKEILKPWYISISNRTICYTRIYFLRHKIFMLFRNNFFLTMFSTYLKLFSSFLAIASLDFSKATSFIGHLLPRLALSNRLNVFHRENLKTSFVKMLALGLLVVRSCIIHNLLCLRVE